MNARVKPSLRGVSHQWGACLAAPASLVLVVIAPSARSAWAAGIYGLTLVALLGISALYHRPTWSPPARARLRRFDHSAIFFLIAGTYTPICMLVLGEQEGAFALRLVWAGAGLGILQAIFWPTAPKPLVAILCVMLGWVAIWEWTALTTQLNSQVLIFIATGGVLYTLGAITYALRRPDPWPTVFGYHEIFHALVLVASVLHFTAIAQIIFEFGVAATI